MLKNYLKIAFRNFFKQRFYSIVNIIGLAGRIALLIAIFTIGHQAYRASFSNPVDALKYE